jgi:large subunit ribosomal protein L25
VPLHFIGESPAVFQQEGSLFKNIEEVEVETLPANLPPHIEIDISILDDFSKSIHISDIKAPEGVEILEDAEQLICKVDPPRSEEEMAALDEEIGEAIPEGAAEEGAEATEGEAKEGEVSAEAESKE